jgi:hypothetical protein
LSSIILDEARLRKLTLGGIDMPREDVEGLKRELPQVKVERTEPNKADSGVVRG